MKLIPINAKKLTTLYTGKTDQEIAEMYSVGASTVRRWRRDFGILSHPRGSSGIANSNHISDDVLRTAVQDALSKTDLVRNLGFAENSRRLKIELLRRCVELGIDTSHFGKRRPVLGFLGSRHHTTEEILNGAPWKSHAYRLKNRLIEEGLKKDVCEECGQLPCWNGKALTLPMDHINGDPTDNRLENLRVLCPNCHAQTPTFGFKNRKAKPGQCKCGAKIKPGSYRCHDCASKSQEKTRWPRDTLLRKLVWEMPVSKLALQFGVSDVAIKKRCRKLGIPVPGRGYWQKPESQRPPKPEIKKPESKKEKPPKEKRISKINLCACGERIQRNSFRCYKCSAQAQERVTWPSDETLQQMIWERPANTIAKEIGVSGSAVKKRCKHRNIPTPPPGYWQKLQAKT